jgi:type VI secretion system secreted protein VgrG
VFIGGKMVKEKRCEMNAQDIAGAIRGGLLQQDRLLKFDTPLGENVLLPQRAVGCSRIGRHFDFTLDVLSMRSGIKLKELVGQSVTLWIQQGDKSYLPWNGYVYSVRRQGSEGSLTSYQIRFAATSVSGRIKPLTKSSLKY